jgi:hypothetical protein
VTPHPGFRSTHVASDVEKHGHMPRVVGQCAEAKEATPSCWRLTKPILAMMNARVRVWRSPNRLET